jgi:hypothetical protein
MSLDVTEKILRRSRYLEPLSFPHPKWLLIAHSMGIPIQTIETDNVLKFETPEQQRGAIEAKYGRIHKYDDLVRAGHRINEYQELGLQAPPVTGREWKLRLGTAADYLSFLQNHLPEIVDDSRRVRKLDRKIDGSLIEISGAWSKLTGEYFGQRAPERPPLPRA